MGLTEAEGGDDGGSAWWHRHEEEGMILRHGCEHAGAMGFRIGLAGGDGAWSLAVRWWEAVRRWWEKADDSEEGGQGIAWAW